MKPLLPLLLPLLAVVTVVRGENALTNHLFNLNGVDKAQLTVVKADVWPETMGEAVVCPWRGDKLAALSFTIDDNTAPDVDWWLAQSAKRDIPLTWFLISGKINQDSYAGTWELWRKVLAQGHEVGSHTVTHLVGADDPATWKGIDWEYNESKVQLEAGLPGHKIGFLAYPGGKNMPLNNHDVAAGRYLAARGVQGVINPRQGFDYMNISSIGRPNLGESSAVWSDLRGLLDSQVNKGLGYGGWAVLLFHAVQPKRVDEATAMLEFAADNRAQLWVDKFGDIARYGQERDTSSLITTTTAVDHISFTLTDRMDDAYYDYPLTVKVRVPDAWTTVVAKQQGARDLAITLMEHNGGHYALVDVVPDAGDVVIRPGNQR
jgi:peptidoglycan/xylan/chitin deacetylase (PgdA/CDA1 family)